MYISLSPLSKRIALISGIEQRIEQNDFEDIEEEYNSVYQPLASFK